MPIIKRPLNPRRLRSALPHGFGWIDHRFLTDGYLSRLTSPARSLYCLLVCAADAHGLSYYSEPRLCQLLDLRPQALLEARRELLALDLLAYQKPLAQILTIEDPGHLRFFPEPTPAVSQPRPVSLPHSPRCPEPSESPKPAAPTGLNLLAMVEASLRNGGLV